MKMNDRISVVEYLQETKDDFNSPTTSTFTSKIALCRSTIASLEESLDADRAILKKLKNAVKALHGSGLAHNNNEAVFIEVLEKLGSAALSNTKDNDPDIGSAFLKLAVFTKELSALLKNLISAFNNLVVIPLETLLKGDLKGVRGDMKRPFDKSWKDYDTKVKQVEREKRQLAKDAGMIRNEISGAEIAEEMEKERRMFQLQMCEYLIKVNEINTKKGADLLQHLIEYYNNQNVFFTEGYKTIEHLKTYAADLTANLHSVRQAQDEEKRQLVELKNILKSSITEVDAPKSNTSVYNLHQLQGSKEYGIEHQGHLMKRSEGLRKVWQKRQCSIRDGFLTISHNNMSKSPVKLNLLTSQVKLVPEDKKQFDLVSHNRTYRFMADDEASAKIWVSVISNSKEDALNRVFHEEGNTEQNSGLRELTRSILDEIKLIPGNNKCCDCGKADPTWLSTNLGVLTCIECSGIHRDMGVHISRIQSITLDELGTSELLLARSIGNNNFNDIMEGRLNAADKPTPDSDMDLRKSFIRAKYEGRVYAMHTCNGNADRLAEDLKQAILSRDVFALLQVFAEGGDLTVPLPGMPDNETALHLAITQNDGLHLVDFLVQNNNQNLNIQTLNGQNTPLHISAEYNKTECMKLLLRSRAKTDIVNASGETPLDIARKKNYASCEDLLIQAANGKFPQTVHVDIDWDLSLMEDEEFPQELSDDETDSSSTAGLLQPPINVNSPFKTPTQTPVSRGRPISAVLHQSLTPSTPSGPEIIRQRPTSYKGRRPNQSPLIPPRPDKNMVGGKFAHTRTTSDTSRITIDSKAPPPPTRIQSSNIAAYNKNPDQKNSVAQLPILNNAQFGSTPNKKIQNTAEIKNTASDKPAKKFFRKKYSQLRNKNRPRPVLHAASDGDKNKLPEPADEPPLLPEKQSAHNDAPMPLPRASGSMSSQPTRVRAIYDCKADNPDELTFVENEIIVVTGVEDHEWWIGHVEHQPHRSGVFPMSFVYKLPD